MKVSKLIHDLHEEIDEVTKQNVGLRNANEIYSKQNIDLRKNQDQDSLNRELSSSKIGNVIQERTIKDLKMEIESLKKENKMFKKDNHLFRQDNADLKAKLEDESESKWDRKVNDSIEEDEPFHTTIYDENMKRLAYLEKHVAENRYVFTEIPNTPENLKMVKLMKKHINKRKYTLRWRGQYLIDGEDWRSYTYGQPLSKSKCIRVYIDSKAYSVDTVEGFNMSEVKVIMDSLDKQMDVCSSFLLAHDRDDGDQDIVDERNILDQAKQLHSYFESMKLHLENSASTPIKDNVNIVIPKGDKQCHTK